MSYKESCDYINVNLKRLATEDELRVINNFWEEILPYRYLKKSNKKLFKKNIFGDKILKKIKICNRFLNVSANIVNDESSIGNCYKKFLSKAIEPDISVLSASDCDIELLKNFREYSETLQYPLIGNICNNHRNSEVFSLSLNKKKNIFNSKTSNGLNIIVVGEPTSIRQNVRTSDINIQKQLVEFTQEAKNKKLIKAIESCEKGIFYALLKLIQKRKFGIFVNINNLHKTSDDGQAWEYLTSNTPERIIFGVQNRKLVDFIRLIDKYKLPFSIIGKIDKSKSVRVVHKNAQTIYLNKKLIFNPLMKSALIVAPTENENFSFGENISHKNFNEIIFDNLFVSKQNLFKNFDINIGNKTVFIYNEIRTIECWYENVRKYISMSVNTNNLQLKFNPYVAAQNCVCKGVRKLITIGHKPVGLSLHFCADFSKAESSQIFNKVKEGVYFISKKLKIKVINITFSKSEDTSFSVLLTGMKNDKFYTSSFENGQKIYIIGKPDNLPATSTYQEIVGDNIFPYPDEVNSRFEKRLLKCVRKMQKKDLLAGLIPVEEFGIAGSLIKALSKHRLGFKCYRKDLNLNYLFNETQSRFLVATNENIEKILKRYKVPYTIFGETIDSDCIELSDEKIDCEDFYVKYFGEANDKILD